MQSQNVLANVQPGIGSKMGRNNLAFWFEPARHRLNSNPTVWVCPFLIQHLFDRNPSFFVLYRIDKLFHPLLMGAVYKELVNNANLHL